MTSMRTPLFIYIFVLASIIITSCKDNDSTSKSGVAPDEQLVMSVSATDRLYTTEYVVNKAVTYDDIVKLKGTIFSKDFDFTLPQGQRKIIIPMEARIKAYIDFSSFSKDNVIISPDSSRIRIILPDPKVELTSTRINHTGILTFVDFGRSRFSGAEMAELERQGRAAIIAAIPQMDIIATARHDAYSLIMPMVQAMGYSPEQVTVDFRSDLTPDTYLQSLINNINRD